MAFSIRFCSSYYFISPFLRYFIFLSQGDSSAVSSDTPDWQAYLMRRHFLIWLRDRSSHWRATCRYNTDSTVNMDYLRASFEDFHIVRVKPTGASSCPKYELFNIRGNECANCKAGTWYLKVHYALIAISMEIRVVMWYLSRPTGYYQAVNPKFRSSSSSEATTQFWFRSK